MEADHWACVCGAVRSLAFCSYVGDAPPCPECPARRTMIRIPAGHRLVVDPETGDRRIVRD